MNGTSRLQQVQDDADEVKVIMMENMNKVDERSDKLGDLETRAEDLHEKAKGFEKKTNKVMQQKRCENKKMRYVFIGIGVVVAIVIIITIIFTIVG
ncbi:vesicle-associated membrane protein 5 [Gymnodraco acuticeps]|uniref:Vesicle-associated membrane protein 5 n=1 Tax=Gymnodraco acuticeps TaxID=8218 RepID=A0A6P8UYN6_GYMAC|nr:vesicle-associated membrane protein 5 [Gymnodraco acuticeps]